MFDKTLGIAGGVTFSIPALYSIQNVYGVHVNKTMATSDNVFASYRLTDRENILFFVQTMPLLIATLVR
jgi:hypothetical protein